MGIFVLRAASSGAVSPRRGHRLAPIPATSWRYPPPILFRQARSSCHAAGSCANLGCDATMAKGRSNLPAVASLEGYSMRKSRPGAGFVLVVILLASCSDGGGGLTSPGAGGTPGLGGMGGTGGTGAGGIGGSGGTAGTSSTICRPASPCPTGRMAYQDTICPWPSGTCTPNGDGLCYQRCSTDADCTDSKFPLCSGSIYLYGGSDYGQTVHVCQSVQDVAGCASPQGIDGGSP